LTGELRGLLIASKTKAHVVHVGLFLPLELLKDFLRLHMELFRVSQSSNFLIAPKSMEIKDATVV